MPLLALPAGKTLVPITMRLLSGLLRRNMLLVHGLGVFPAHRNQIGDADPITPKRIVPASRWRGEFPLIQHHKTCS
jgi:hypothetical protein